MQKGDFGPDHTGGPRGQAKAGTFGLTRLGPLPLVRAKLQIDLSL